MCTYAKENATKFAIWQSHSRSNQILVSKKLFGNRTLAISRLCCGAKIHSFKWMYIIFVFSVCPPFQCCVLGTLEFLQRSSLLQKHMRARTVSQDVLKEKQPSSLACTVPLFFYNHRNLRLEIHTSVRVVIMCQWVWSRGGGLLSSWLNKK